MPAPRRLPLDSATSPVAGTRSRTSPLADYLALTKPSILLLVVITGLPALLMAAGGGLDWRLGAAALLGTALASASAAAINHYLDRDIDALMQRTRRRPVPAGRVAPRRALAFGLALAVLAVAVLWAWTTALAAAIALAAILYYALLYTAWLKRITPHNIVIGGLAGASAPLIGWAAVTGTVGWPAWALVLIIFLWTPPHFWSLALCRRAEYAHAGVPMLPVVAGPEATRNQILAYSAALIPATLVLVPAGRAGALYAVAAVVLGGVFLGRALAVWRGGSPAACMKLFSFSIAYLLLLFAALTIDALLGFRFSPA